MKIAKRDDIVRIDRLCEENYGLSTSLLMEHAAGAVLEIIKEEVPGWKQKKYLIFCGPGNNGGDGAGLARLLYSEGIAVKAVFVGDVAVKSAGPALANFQMLEKLFVPIRRYPQELSLIEQEISSSDILIDAVYGVGFHGKISETVSPVISLMNRSGKEIVAVDIPSGVYADGGVSDMTVRATLTISLALPKAGCLDYPGKAFAGRLRICPIGIPDILLTDNAIKQNYVSEEMVHSLYKPRARDSHKGTHGHLLLIGGCVGNLAIGQPIMSGAPILAGMAGLYTGAGLLTAAVPGAIASIVQSALPEAMTLALDTADTALSQNGIEALINSKRIHTVLIGNGFGVGDFQKDILLSLLHSPQVQKMVIDADGLNNLASIPNGVKGLSGYGKKIILTPHIGEMTRLTGKDASWIKRNKTEAAVDLALETAAVVVLKDSVSIIADSQGKSWLSDRGSPALAKGGAGDILAGMIAGLSLSYSLIEASILGCQLLGRAGELCEKKYNTISPIARDILNCIPVILGEIEKNQVSR